MPDPFERHGRSSDRDSRRSIPPRSQARAAAAADDPLVPLHGKNKTTPKRECNASPDGLHHSEIVDLNIRDRNGVKAICSWRPMYWLPRKEANPRLAYWSCYHIRRCRYCSAKLDENLKVSCPLYADSGEQKKAAEQEALEQHEARLATDPPRRKPVPTGKQSYRKPKEGK